MAAITANYATYPSSYTAQARFSYPQAYVANTDSEQPAPSAPRDSFSRVSSMVATGAGGAFAAHKYSETMAESIFNYQELGELQGAPGVAFATFKEMGGIALKGAGMSALVSAGVSVVANGVGLAKGKLDRETAVKNVVGDTITGAVGGLGAVTLGGLGGLALVKMGMTGLPITIATVAIGAATGVAASALRDKLIKQ